MSESLRVLEPPCVTDGVAGLGDSDTVALGLRVRVVDGDADTDGESKLTLRTGVPVRVSDVDTVRDEDREAVRVLEASTEPVRLETDDVFELLRVRLLENVTAVFAKLGVSD